METLSWMYAAVKAAALALIVAITGAESRPGVYQGYVEADYVRVGPRESGRIERLAVARGDSIGAGELLFRLEDVAETAARDEARGRLRQAEAQLDDLRKGRRTPEINVILARKTQAEASLRLSAAQLKRQEQLVATAAASQGKLDEARAAFDRDQARVVELNNQLQMSRLAARDDEIRAAVAAVAQAKAGLDQAEWRLAQRSAVAPASGRIADTLYVEGEFVAGGLPVVSILPESNLKVRFFVPQAELGRVRIGATARLDCDGCPGSIAVRISFIAPQAEYTPPVIYSMESRDKLVFLVEARPVAPAPRLNPGQPVDVTLSP